MNLLIKRCIKWNLFLLIMVSRLLILIMWNIQNTFSSNLFLKLAGIKLLSEKLLSSSSRESISLFFNSTLNNWTRSITLEELEVSTPWNLPRQVLILTVTLNKLHIPTLPQSPRNRLTIAALLLYHRLNAWPLALNQTIVHQLQFWVVDQLLPT